MTEQTAIVRGRTHRLPVVGTTRGGTYSVVDNRAARVRPGKYFAVHTQTGKALPILNDIDHTRREYLAFAQEIEDLCAFDRITGEPTSDTDIRAHAVATSKGWGK